MDYHALGTKLRLRSAVEIQPLAKYQVEDYLAHVGEPLVGLRTALTEDASTWELLETPLMLWVAMLTYRDVQLASLQGQTMERRQRALFAQFVEAMFQRRINARRFTPEQTKRWLCWLACALTRTNQGTFYLENLDFDWFSTRSAKWLPRAGFVVAIAILLGLIFGMSFAVPAQLSGNRDWPVLLISGLIFGFILGLIFGPVSIVAKLRPAEHLAFPFANTSSR